MHEAVIVSAVRTPIGKLGGAMREVLVEHLAATVIGEALKRAKLEPGAINEVIFGHAKQSSDTPNLARVAALYADLPVEIPAYTVHRQCGSGLQAVISAAQAIRLGDAGAVICGGAESMSTAPYYLRSARFGYGSGNGELLDSNTESQPKSQPVEVYGRLTMGMTAENLAEKYQISRQEQDEFACLSQAKALAAIAQGKFEAEILPVEITEGKNTRVFTIDEFPRQTSVAELAKLRPIFKKDGTVTAGNSSGRNDGAAAMVMLSRERAIAMGIRPLARVVSYASAGVSPEIMGIGPVPATRKALALAGLSLTDIGLIELNEAFAAQSLAVIKELGAELAKINVNGGAIALGHPIGATGARIAVTLLYEMLRQGVRYGLATLCIAGGQGTAVIFENLATAN
ncbi:MAG: thiolase family protein [Negativicutes bacterium]|nr:thiolase family protein [Negativicutes bacterium]